MGMHYTEELAAWAQRRTQQKRRQDINVVAFMAIKTDVMEAMAAGYTLTTIWEHMLETGKLKCSYETFRRHVQRFIKTRPKEREETISTPSPTGANGTAKEPKKIEAPTVGGFKFVPTPNKEELI